MAETGEGEDFKSLTFLMEKLEDGWDGEGSYAPNKQTIENAQLVFDSFKLPEVYAWPEANGCVGVESDVDVADAEKYGYVHFIAGTDKINGFVTLPGKKETEYFNLSVEEFKEKLPEILVAVEKVKAAYRDRKF